VADLIVNLYEKDFLDDTNVKLKNKDIKIKRLLSPNADNLVKFVKDNFSDNWASEIKAGVYKNNPTCFVATHNNDIIGFACYDVTAKGYFGPTGVNQNYRGNNVGQILLLTTLDAMKEAGYGYAIIGGVNKKVQGFYSRYLNFKVFESKKDLYSRLINR